MREMFQYTSQNFFKENEGAMEIKISKCASMSSKFDSKEIYIVYNSYTSVFYAFCMKRRNKHVFCDSVTGEDLIHLSVTADNVFYLYYCKRVL